MMLTQLVDSGEGTSLPELRVTPTSDSVRQFLDATGFGIPIFHDQQAAEAAGLRGPIVPAEWKSGVLIVYLRRLAQPDGKLLRLQSAFRRPDYHGNPITITGQITRIDLTNQVQQIHLELQIIQQTTNLPSVRSSATLHLPGLYQNRLSRQPS